MKTRLALIAIAVTVALPVGPSVAHAVLPRCPNVLVVQDGSGSMCGSKWTQATAAVNGILSRNELAPVGNRLRYGLVLYPSDDLCAAGTWLVHPGAGTEPQVRSAMTTYACDSGRNTPTAQTLAAINANPAELADSTRPNYIIHVTDGQPNCSGTPSEVESTVLALRNTRQITTFVVGFSDGVSPSHLHRQAINGGAPRPGCNTNPAATSNFCYYQANTGADLAQVLDAIATIIGGQFSGGISCDESCYGQGCPDEQLCLNATCVASPCASVTCQADEFCRSGTCVKACLAPCPPGKKCVDGACADDPCDSVFCRVEQNEVCRNGVCITDPCVARWDGGADARCRFGQSCLPDGTCGDEPCQSITCPEGTVCVAGQCQSTSAFVPPQQDAAVPEDGGGGGDGDGSTIQRDGALADGAHPADGPGVDTGNSACGCQGAGQAGGLVLAIALMVLALGRRRR